MRSGSVWEEAVLSLGKWSQVCGVGDGENTGFARVLFLVGYRGSSTVLVGQEKPALCFALQKPHLRWNIGTWRPAVGLLRGKKRLRDRWGCLACGRPKKYLYLSHMSRFSETTGKKFE